MNAYVTPIRIAIQNEHRELTHMIRTINQLLVEEPDFAKWEERSGPIKEQLTTLRSRLKQHFDREERDGYLDEAVATLPRLAIEAFKIKNEHSTLLQELDSLVKYLSHANPSREAWNHISQDYRECIKHILQHESAENRLLQTGLNEEFDLEP